MSCASCGGVGVGFLFVLRAADSWPNLDSDEQPDCNLLFCSYADGDKNYFSSQQEEIVGVYEVGRLGGIVPFGGGESVSMGNGADGATGRSPW